MSDLPYRSPISISHIDLPYRYRIISCHSAPGVRYGGLPVPQRLGRAVQVDPVKITKSKRLKPDHGTVLSNHACKFNMRRYVKVRPPAPAPAAASNGATKSSGGLLPVMVWIHGRGLRSSTFQLNLSLF